MSSSTRFNKGSSFLLDRREVSVSRVIKNSNLVTLEDTASLEVFQHTKEQLLEMWLAGRITSHSLANLSADKTPKLPAVTLLYSCPQRLVDDAMRRKSYLDALSSMAEKIVFTPAKLKPLLEQIARKLGDPKVPSAISFYRWFKLKLKHDSHPLALLEKPQSRGWFGCRFPMAVQGLCCTNPPATAW